MYLHTFYVLFQTSFTIKSGVTDVAWKRFDIFMFDFNVFFEIAKTWRFIPAYMTNMKFTFFGMRVFFVLFQALNEFITCFHEFWNFHEFFSRNFICLVFLRGRRFRLGSNADEPTYSNNKIHFAELWKKIVKKNRIIRTRENMWWTLYMFQSMSKIALVAFPGFLCFMFIHDMLLKQLEILKIRK